MEITASGLGLFNFIKSATHYIYNHEKIDYILDFAINVFWSLKEKKMSKMSKISKDIYCCENVELGTTESEAECGGTGGTGGTDGTGPSMDDSFLLEVQATVEVIVRVLYCMC